MVCHIPDRPPPHLASPGNYSCWVQNNQDLKERVLLYRYHQNANILSMRSINIMCMWILIIARYMRSQSTSESLGQIWNQENRELGKLNFNLRRLTFMVVLLIGWEIFKVYLLMPPSLWEGFIWAFTAFVL